MKKRLLRLYLLLLVVLAGCLLLGYIYQRAGRQVKLNRALAIAVKRLDVSAVKSCLNEGADANTLHYGNPDLEFLPFLKRLFTRWQTQPAQDGATFTVFQCLVREAIRARSNGLIDPGDISYDLHKRLPDYDAIGEALVRHGADTHFSMEDIELFGSPLRCTAMLRMDKTVQSMLARGEDVNARDAFGSYPLIGADTESTAMMLRLGARPNVSSGMDDGKTPLHSAAADFRGGTETVRLLLAAGANPNATDDRGKTPLMCTDVPETAKLLIQYGADVNAKDKYGARVLDYAEGGHLSFTVSMEEQKQLQDILKRHGAKR